jgi:hypothetical protein
MKLIIEMTNIESVPESKIDYEIKRVLKSALAYGLDKKLRISDWAYTLDGKPVGSIELRVE